MTTLNVTIDDVGSWGPCRAVPQDRIVELFAGRPTITAADILTMDIADDHKLWCLLRPEMIEPETLALIKGDFLALVEPENVYYEMVINADPLADSIGKLMRALAPQSFAVTAHDLLTIVETYI